jgi:hypothetical protein
MAEAYTPAIAASSLGPLLALASDPPLEARSLITQFHNGGEPLVLYIARVPGSRDVFLTPVKPRGKVVGAEDVNSSLYYLHAHVSEERRQSEAASDGQVERKRAREQPSPPPGQRRGGDYANGEQWRAGNEGGSHRSNPLDRDRRLSSPGFGDQHWSDHSGSSQEPSPGFPPQTQAVRQKRPLDRQRRQSTPNFGPAWDNRHAQQMANRRELENTLPPDRPPPPPPHRYSVGNHLDTELLPPPDRPWNRYSVEARARSSSPAHRDGYQNHTGYQNGSSMSTPMSSSPPKALRRKPVGTAWAKTTSNGYNANVARPLGIRTSQSAVFNSHSGTHFNSSPSPREQPSPGVPPYPMGEVFPDPDVWRPKKPNKMPYESDIFHQPPSPRTGGPVRSPNAPPGPRRPHSMDMSLKNYPKLQPPQPQESPLVSPTLSISYFTLIRRDPATGQQWNVARLRQSPKRISPYEAHPSAALEITINTPGYTKFVQAASRSGSRRPSLAGPSDWTESTVDLAVSPTRRSSSFEAMPAVFRREVFMEGLQETLATAAPGHSRSKSEDVDHNRGRPQHDDQAVRSRNNSKFSIPTASVSTANLFSSKYNVSGITARPNKRRTGVSFTSPWQGVCEFTSTINNSLRCKHVLGPSLLGSQPSPPVNVSELRFNLPSATKAPTMHPNGSQYQLIGQPSSSVATNGVPPPVPPKIYPDGPVLLWEPNPSDAKLTRRSRFFAKLKKPFIRRGSEPAVPSLISPTKPPPALLTRTSPTTPTSGAFYNFPNGAISKAANGKQVPGRSVLDLSLGKEKAGGGSGGKDAKMGKLIVEEEGLKMLDLVVAVNIGLWWRAWEKS